MATVLIWSSSSQGKWPLSQHQYLPAVLCCDCHCVLAESHRQYLEPVLCFCCHSALVGSHLLEQQLVPAGGRHWNQRHELLVSLTPFLVRCLKEHAFFQLFSLRFVPVMPSTFQTAIKIFGITVCGSLVLVPVVHIVLLLATIVSIVVASTVMGRQHCCCFYSYGNITICWCFVGNQTWTIACFQKILMTLVLK